MFSKLYFFLLSLLILSSCTKETVLLKIKHHQSPCVGANEPQLCYNVLFQDSTDWEFFYDEIEGFKYQIGYDYELELSVKKVHNSQIDASPDVFKLKKVISKTINTNSFTLPVQYDNMTHFINKDTSNNYFLCNQLQFSFSDESLVTQLDSIQVINGYFEATFEIDSINSQIRLISF